MHLRRKSAEEVPGNLIIVYLWNYTHRCLKRLTMEPQRLNISVFHLSCKISHVRCKRFEIGVVSEQIR